ncbi:MAG: bifunctional methylenetetrahydrofolate dehydrogenase/methenyltetrahydrofolate cyclohydrolase FolD [Elusimicrobia bacterium]|nr:bifunctional methylenetetrahydrofolate dehydrogenase/methenyltetrahydrofolate cyclohydrolase FolD [Elusimicrobiota bacterium]
MQIIDGKKISAEIRAELKAKVSKLKEKGTEPGLAAILVGDDPASHVYVASKIKACEALGIKSFHHKLPSSTKEEEVLELICVLNNDSRVNGILLQLPLPLGINPDRCLEEISPEKDVDGLTPISMGRLFSLKRFEEIEKNKLFVPCTPLGVIFLLKKYNIPIEGKNAVVLGRSNLVGKPLAMLFLSNNATVTMAHSQTRDVPEICRKADILVAAIGQPQFVKKEFVKEGAAVIDVGINREDSGLSGDVDFDSVKEVAGFITPVPGGVGPMTITMLMHNTVLASIKY